MHFQVSESRLDATFTGRGDQIKGFLLSAPKTYRLRYRICSQQFADVSHSHLILKGRESPSKKPHLVLREDFFNRDRGREAWVVEKKWSYHIMGETSHPLSRGDIALPELSLKIGPKWRVAPVSVPLQDHHEGAPGPSHLGTGETLRASIGTKKSAV
jgi:hypothetical protein